MYSSSSSSSSSSGSSSSSSYVHRNRFVRNEEPRTSTSTFTHSSRALTRAQRTNVKLIVLGV